MTDYWIFVVTDAKIGKKQEKGVNIFKQRMSDAFWGLRKSTPNRKRLKAGDKVVFYLGGEEGQLFLGACTLASAFYKLNNEERKRYGHDSLILRSEFGVKLADIDIWATQKSIRPFIKRLSFIHIPHVWGSYLQGGVRAISKDDFNLIVFGKEPPEQGPAHPCMH